MCSSSSAESAESVVNSLSFWKYSKNELPSADDKVFKIPINISWGSTPLVLCLIQLVFIDIFYQLLVKNNQSQ